MSSTFVFWEFQGEFEAIIMQKTGFAFFSFVLSTRVTWQRDISAVVPSSYWPFGLSYEGAEFLPACLRMRFLIIVLSSVSS